MLFAEELPTSAIVPGQAVTIVIVIWTVMFMVAAFSAIFCLIMMVRRKPSIDAEFATKSEMKAGFDRVDADLVRFNSRNEELTKQVFAELKSMNTSINHEFSSLNRGIGKLEGAQDIAGKIAAEIRK